MKMSNRKAFILGLSISNKDGYRQLFAEISDIISHGHAVALRQIDTTQVITYWLVGRCIVEFYQRGKNRAEYGEQILIRLSSDLNVRFGKGYSVDNLQNMRRLYVEFPKLLKNYETLSHKSQKESVKIKYEEVSRILSWSHYCELLKEDNLKARSFYEIESIENGWSTRELRRQMNSYLNYFRENETADDENPPIGIILCSKKNAVYSKYVLGNLNNKIFASKYKLTLPTEKELDRTLRIKNG